VRNHALECLLHPDMSADEIVNSVMGVLGNMPY
jgi:hypothetical protein